jgi:hypothetical protein
MYEFTIKCTRWIAKFGKFRSTVTFRTVFKNLKKKKSRWSDGDKSAVCLSVCLPGWLAAASTAIQYQSYTRLNVTDVAVTMERRHTMSTWNSFSELPVDKMSPGQPSGHYNWHVFCYVIRCKATFLNITMKSRLLSLATWCRAVWYSNKRCKCSVLISCLFPKGYQ